MAKRSTLVMAAAGIVLVAAGAIAKWVVAPALVKAPLDITSTTVAEGNSKVFVIAAQAVQEVHVIATRVVTGDKHAGTGDVAVYDETLCLVAEGTKVDSAGCASAADPGFIEKTTDRVAFDRVDATAVADQKYKANVNGDAAVKHTGLDYTFPIDTAKRTYSLFDTIAGKAFPAKYEGSQTLHGLTVYRFVQQIPDTPIKIQSLIPGIYSGTTTVWVEPTTGVIVKGAQHIVQKFASDESVVFDGTLTFNDKTVREQADFADDQLTKIHLIRNWVPLALAMIGILLLATAWFAARRRRPSEVVPTEPLASPDAEQG
ncbi:DUF3068 domain-containing protein [Jatrophihabitans cynanchi]|uniref:DUF3068 domain-containing protein n=1 Tax=Jatrophihabitans cynanchi TaxID=2944128 RepID=A0ABY7JYY8_9ACTN|nr:DUF3068 domain-containing protein [Jatrophihabitans sp. SB3-54]WAX57777.1 DUF3068 domain-containing protein [Jatrophihabitans sp. SB3-54]